MFSAFGFALHVGGAGDRLMPIPHWLHNFDQMFTRSACLRLFCSMFLLGCIPEAQAAHPLAFMHCCQQYTSER